MFVFTPFVILALTAVGRVVSETYKKGGVAVLSPGSVSGPITSITWKHGPDIAVERYGEETTPYRDFRGRCEVNITTGALTISNLRLNDSGSYTAEINNRIMKTTEIIVLSVVPKPTISTQCNPEVTQCTLTCNARITADMGTVTYSWKTGDSQRPESSSNQLDITKDETELVGKLISCQLKNPVSSERSDDIMNPITNERSEGVSTAAVVAPVIVLVVVAVLVGIVCWHKRRPGNADQSWGQYLARFNRKNFLNPAESSRGTETNANGVVIPVSYTPVPTEDRQVPVSTGTDNEPAAIPESQEDPNQHQPEAESTDTNNGAATSSEKQEDPNQHQPEAESTDTDNEPAAIPESQEDPNQHQPEAESTDTNNGAETSAEAPNAEEPPDHHQQQEDETTEE